MPTFQKYLDRVNILISLADKTLATTVHPQSQYGIPYVNRELFNELRTSCLSYIQNLYGGNHPYYIDFGRVCSRPLPADAEQARGILRAIKSEIENNWLTSMKGIVSAEIFSDFLDMAEHLLEEKFHHAAAVMIGSVLEEHLRQLCDSNGISTTNDGKPSPKKADSLNAELTGKGVYNKLDQKNVTAWLDLRNKAAHGKYGEYNLQQVELMLQGVREFMARNSI